jgi:hypothetical protein
VAHKSISSTHPNTSKKYFFDFLRILSVKYVEDYNMSVLDNKVLIRSIPVQRPANPLKGLPVGTFKVAAKLNLAKGKWYHGNSYVQMMNNAILTNVGTGYIKSSHPLDHVGLYDALAWFAFFDGQYRRSGKDGEYKNTFASNDEIISMYEQYLNSIGEMEK